MGIVKTISRFEINKRVRNILVKHGVSMHLMQNSCAGHTIYLKGTLLKENEAAFELQAVEYLLSDITALSFVKHLVIDFTNWKIVHEGSSFAIEKKDDPLIKKKELIKKHDFHATKKSDEKDKTVAKEDQSTNITFDILKKNK
ncbi:MAG: hypothetical protein HQK53_14270 [Oligoflexia bacterium]|nr:hypothetical protein [Oligoflexia bacterium]